MVIQIVVNDCDLGVRHILGEDITIFWQYIGLSRCHVPCHARG